MKKTIILLTLACIVSFTLGMSAGWHGHKSQSRAVYRLAILKGKLADSIMSNNNVYDMDGSDQMASYLYVSARLDTLLAKQRALCLICSLRHDLCTRGIIARNTFERVRTQINGIIEHFLGHVTFLLVRWKYEHSCLATNKHLLLTNDNNQY